MAAPSPESSRPHAIPIHSSVTELLADRPSRSIIGALGEAGAASLDGPQLAATFDFPVSGRLVRDRLRVLERWGLVVATSRASSDGSQPARWTLTEAGRDLHRVLSLMTRIAARAARLPDGAASGPSIAALSCTLEALADPVVVAVLRPLVAGREIDPVALEAACPDVPRRTLYRRLRPLVDAGVVVRETTRQVPRRTRYSFSDRWRPAAAVLVLAVWWEGRHLPVDLPDPSLELGGIIAAVGPTARPRVGTSPVVAQLRNTDHDELTAVTATRTGISVGGIESDAGAAACTIAGSTHAWMAALVEGAIDGLEIHGDRAAAEALLAALRAATLAYVR